jgi:hypothetical protein
MEQLLENKGTGRVFYAYTPHPTPFDRAYGFGERATVATQLLDVNGEKIFYYGVAICSATDNFNKTEGRRLALSRLQEGYGKTKWNDHYQGIADFFAAQGENDGTERATIQFVNDLANSVAKKIRKHKRKLENLKK